ncbi:MAG: CoA-acylating methylmalonate-semialdehyde dehydrogenase [Polyangiaceae bacterium]
MSSLRAVLRASEVDLSVRIPSSSKELANFVGGAWVTPPDAPMLPVTSPYTGAQIARVPMSSADDVLKAVSAAKAAQPAWAATPIKERAARMFRFRQLLLEHLETLSHSAAAESGKTLAEATAEVLKGVEVVEFATALQNSDTGSILEVSRGITCEYRREPLGVVAGIVPFNFPAMVPMWMFPIAVTLGNAFVLKPSEKVPMTACLLADLMAQAGIPAGVFSLVHGGAETVATLTTAPDVKAVGFVGSSGVARRVYELGTAQMKRVLALGGAKNHLIVVPDADEALTVQAVVDSFTGCAGQRCMAASVLVAVGEVDGLIQKIVARASQIELGPGMGAIIDEGAVTRITAAIDKAVGEGAKVLLDGRNKKPAMAEYAGGSWLGPTILDGVSPDHPIRHTEVFGPVLAIVRARTLKEAIAIQNSSAYGNAASVFTTSGFVAQTVAEHATAGMIGVNVGVPVPREPFSFGGINESKFGAGDITGPSSVDFWTIEKKITRKWAVQSDTTWMG